MNFNLERPITLIQHVRMKIICAETVLLGKVAFENVGQTIVIPDREITRKDLLDADALIVRSKTKIGKELLEGTPVKFVGTATAGMDHFDTEWLDANNIAWTASPGCNANSVSEYVVAALLTLCDRYGFSLAGKTIGVIGCGNVGSRVVKKCEALGMTVLQNDPPLAAASEDAAYCSLDTLLLEADIITMHVPLTKEGPWATVEMADYCFFEQLKPNTLFINASRGGVVDYDALLDARQKGTVSHTVIDVWNPEPTFRLDVLKWSDIASPHIAGHSYEGKLNGTIACYNKLCQFFNLPETWDIAASLPTPETPTLSIDTAELSDEKALLQIITPIYSIETDDQLIRQAAVLNEIDRAKNFDALRKNYRIRREFMNTKITLENSTETLQKKIQAMGFCLAN